MGIPKLDIEFSRKPIAIILNTSNELDYYVLEPKQDSKFFIIEKYGVFEIDSNYACRSKKTPILFYYSEYPKPIHLRYHALLHRWAKNNKVDKITKKDLRHSGLFDRLAVTKGQTPTLQMVQEYENMAAERIDAMMSKTNQMLQKRNEEAAASGKPPVEIDPLEYSTYILDSLIQDKVLNTDEALRLKFDMINGNLSFDEFILKLKELNTVQIAEPIPLHPRLWLQEASIYNPSSVMTYIKKSMGLEKRIEKLGVPQLRQTIPYWGIAIVLIGFAFAVAVLSNPQTIKQITDLFGFI